MKDAPPSIVDMVKKYDISETQPIFRIIFLASLAIYGIRTPIDKKPKLPSIIPPSDNKNNGGIIQPHRYNAVPVDVSPPPPVTPLEPPITFINTRSGRIVKPLS